MLTQQQFELRIKRRVYQLKRSSIMKKKIDAEMGNKGMTKEEAEAYIARIPEIAKEEYEKLKAGL